MGDTKILFVINQLACGGAEHQLATLCEGLRKRHHQLGVITIYDQLELRNRLDAIEVPVTVANKYAKVDLTVVWRLRSLIKTVNPDLIHAYLPASCLFTGMTKWLGVETPIIQAERSVNQWRLRWRLWLDNLVRRRVASIVCNAKAIRTHLIEEEYVTSRKITLIYNGLAPERRIRPNKWAIDLAREQIGAPLGSFIAICVANFVAEKHHHILLKAFAQARDQVKNLFLVLVGKGELEQNIRNSIERLQLLESSRIISNCIDPLPLLCASDAFILTSAIEGCSNALLEAMAMELPIVATDAGGNVELVTQGLGGIICAVGDVCALANGLVRLAWDSSLSRSMGLYNVARVREEFTDDILVERTVALYRRVLNEAAKKSWQNQSRVKRLQARRNDDYVRYRWMAGNFSQ